MGGEPAARPRIARSRRAPAPHFEPTSQRIRQRTNHSKWRFELIVDGSIETSIGRVTVNAGGHLAGTGAVYSTTVNAARHAGDRTQRRAASAR